MLNFDVDISLVAISAWTVWALPLRSQNPACGKYRFDDLRKVFQVCLSLLGDVANIPGTLVGKGVHQRETEYWLLSLKLCDP